MTKRKVIIHYHIFKNAGTSIDRMLEESYGERWMNFDKPEVGEKISPEEMEEFILDHPSGVAFSSHQLVPPPQFKRVIVFPIILIRHPIDRAYSAYLFEWRKQQGVEEPIGSFAEYIDEKFQHPRQNAIEDFQAFHLANRCYSGKIAQPILDDEDILGNARGLLSNIGYFGIVDYYAESLQYFKIKMAMHFPELIFKEFRENVLQDETMSIGVKLARIKRLLNDCSYISLVMRNQLDLRLYEYALGLFTKMRRDRRS